jgi:hypothetical protein
MNKQTITINRFGSFQTNASSENQCKDVGHKFYDYKVEIITKCNLDKDGFVFDQLLIDKEIKERFENFITSCELCCNEVEKILAKLLEEKNVKPIRTAITVKPNIGEASFTLTTEYETQLESDLKSFATTKETELFTGLTEILIRNK